MPQISIDPNLSLYYRDENPSGNQSILLLHGLGVSSDSWIFQIPALTEAGFRVVAPDLRGFGKSGYYNGRINIATHSHDVRRLILSLNLSPVHIAGISMGGTIALQTALDAPDAIRRVILISTFAHLRPEKASTWLLLLLRFLSLSLLGLPAQAHLVARSLFPSKEQEYLRVAFVDQVLQANPKAYRRTIQALARFDVRHRLSEIQIPTLVITGENDSTVSVNTQIHLARGIKGSKQVIIQSAGHGVTVEKPELVNACMLDFLRAAVSLEFAYEH